MKRVNRRSTFGTALTVLLVILLAGGILALCVKCERRSPGPDPTDPSYDFEFDNYHIVA